MCNISERHDCSKILLMNLMMLKRQSGI